MSTLQDGRQTPIALVAHGRPPQYPSQEQIEQTPVRSEFSGLVHTSGSGTGATLTGGAWVSVKVLARLE